MSCTSSASATRPRRASSTWCRILVPYVFEPPRAVRASPAKRSLKRAHARRSTEESRAAPPPWWSLHRERPTPSSPRARRPRRCAGRARFSPALRRGVERRPQVTARHSRHARRSSSMSGGSLQARASGTCSRPRNEFPRCTSSWPDPTTGTARCVDRAGSLEQHPTRTRAAGEQEPPDALRTAESPCSPRPARASAWWKEAAAAGTPWSSPTAVGSPRFSRTARSLVVPYDSGEILTRICACSQTGSCENSSRAGGLRPTAELRGSAWPRSRSSTTRCRLTHGGDEALDRRRSPTPERARVSARRRVTQSRILREPLQAEQRATSPQARRNHLSVAKEIPGRADTP